MDNTREIKITKTPHTTLEQVSGLVLPTLAHRFLFSQPSEFSVARVFLGAAFGAVSGAGLFLGLMHNISMTITHRLIAGCVFVGICILGGMFSSYFRCSVLLMFPSMLGSRGRAYLMLLVLNGLYQGPIFNIHRNVQNVAFSMGCNIDLQIEHSKIMWRMVTEPMLQVMQDIVHDNKEFQHEARNVSTQFNRIRDEVMGQYGYDALQHSTSSGNSTQDMFSAKTMMRCDYVVEQGIGRCREWFSSKWQECMDAIKAPVINHLLCVPMKFDFLCNVMRVMTPWCREHIPVEGNFGQTFDRLNLSISRLAEEFTAKVVVQKLEQQAVLGVTVLKEFTKELRKAFEEKMIVFEQIAEVVQILLSFTFITIFTSAFGYARHYCRHIRFDNVYITTYFKQIDERRRRAGKRYLLPLKKVEQSGFINPWSLSIHPSELKLVALGLIQVLLLTLFVCILLTVDGILYHIFDIIRRHTFTQFSVTSSHHVDIDITGESMLAKLLRKTIGAFNTSSNLDIQTSNQHCLPQPRALAPEDYLWTFLPLFMMALMCCLQAYSNRLRRVIAAFYFPKREKRRTLFLYNLQIQRRISYVKRLRKQLLRHGKQPKTVFTGIIAVLDRLGWRLRWCCVCGERQRGAQAVECTVPGCGTVYCAQCWRDLGTFCLFCATLRRTEARDSGTDSDVYYDD